jgi:NAD(P)-dependent dehydrogenase (short-subunit alcohol dehydrogenase family)
MSGVRSVLVTGASTGIGWATALRLDAAGWWVFAGVRREEDAASLREAGSERLAPVMLDVTDPGQIVAAVEQVGQAVGEAGLNGLVNNAGIAVPGPLETLPIDDFRRQVEVNLTAHVAVTQAMLPAIRKSASAVPLPHIGRQRNSGAGGGGRIVFITSIGGLMAFPMFGAYHAAKFGLEAVGDVFRQELRPWGIRVSIVEPGSIATPIWERGDREVDAIAGRAGDGHADLYGEAIEAGRQVAMKTGARGIAPEKVAARIEHALNARRPRTRYLVGADARGQALLARVLPDRLLDWLVARATRS